MMLQRYERDGLEILINDETGESFASVSGYARMSGKSRGTISSRLPLAENASDLGFKMAEVLTDNGLRSVRLIPEKIIVEWLKKDNRELYDTMAEVGVRVYLHRAAGYQVRVVHPDQVQSFDAVMVELSKMSQKLDRYVEAVDQYNSLKRNTRELYPNLEGLHDSMTSAYTTIGTSDFTNLRGWLESQSIDMDKGTFHRFAQRVASEYQNLIGSKPETTYNKRGENTGYGYPISLYPMIEMVYKSM